MAFDWEKITEKFALSERKKEKIFFLHISFSLFGVFTALMKIQKSYIFKGWKIFQFFLSPPETNPQRMWKSFGFRRMFAAKFHKLHFCASKFGIKIRKLFCMYTKKNNTAQGKFQKAFKVFSRWRFSIACKVRNQEPNVCAIVPPRFRGVAALGWG